MRDARRVVLETMPSRHDVIVSYWLTADLDDRALAAARALLSPEEHVRHDRFVFERDRRDFAAAHALLRRALSAAAPDGGAPCDWAFVAGPRGKPALHPDAAARTRLSFNLAHTNGLVACVVTRDADVGVDVEGIGRQVDARQLARRFFSHAEVEHLERCSDPACPTRFIEIWTLKEAYVKAIGDGLACPLDEFAFIFEEPDALRFESRREIKPETWRFALFAPSTRHRLAVAVHDESRRERQVIVRPEHAAAPGEADAPLRESSR